MQASRLIASELNALNREMHVVSESTKPDDWLRRAVPGTNLPAFTFWHVVRVIDSTVNMGLRGGAEIIATEPWASKPWSRPDIGTGYTAEQADELAAQVVPAEVLAYADAVRSEVSQWLRALPEEELEAPARLLDRMRDLPAYNQPPILEATAAFEGQPAWLVLAFACFAHGWGHLEEIRVLARAGRQAG
ncbi:MAG TPA: DinB family protein [Candidatus Dormibacteraeota bacterium]|nr:DinB family protein [Candidatus Dormibacteraeota bacterium]